MSATEKLGEPIQSDKVKLEEVLTLTRSPVTFATTKHIKLNYSTRRPHSGDNKAHIQAFLRDVRKKVCTFLSILLHLYVLIYVKRLLLATPPTTTQSQPATTTLISH